MKKHSIPAAFFVAIASIPLSGCIEDPGSRNHPASADGKAARFSTTIAKTRAYDSVWEYDDRIGVYMVMSEDSADDPLWSTFDPHAENMQYGLDLDREDAPTAQVVFSGIDQ